MKKWISNYIRILQLKRWPIHTPAELAEKERRNKIEKLYNNNK